MNKYKKDISQNLHGKSEKEKKPSLSCTQNKLKGRFDNIRSVAVEKFT